jgi:hypothetical protein
MASGAVVATAGPLIDARIAPHHADAATRMGKTLCS